MEFKLDFEVTVRRHGVPDIQRVGATLDLILTHLNESLNPLIEAEGLGSNVTWRMKSARISESESS